MARKKSFLSKLIRSGYKALSVLNTANVIASGNPNKIARHLARKKTTRLGAGIIPKTRK